MTKKEIVELNNQLTSFKHLRGNVKFPYGVNRNLRLLKGEVEDLEGVTKEYNEGRDKIIKSFYKVDEKTKAPLVENNRYQFTDIDKLNEALKQYEVEQKEFLDKYKEILKEEVQIELYKIDLSSLEDLYTVDGGGKDHPFSFSAFELEGLSAIIKEE